MNLVRMAPRYPHAPSTNMIGSAFFLEGQEAAMAAYERTHPAAGTGWVCHPGRDLPAWGITERVDDYCATAYVYSRRRQPVPRLDVAAAITDIDRQEYEQPNPIETMLATINAER